MRKEISLISIAIALVLIFSAHAVAQQDSQEKVSISDELKSVIDQYHTGWEKKEINRVLDAIHTLSPAYQGTAMICEESFPVYDIKLELINFKYLFTDDEYAFARAEVKTEKISDENVDNFIAEYVYIFKANLYGKWKLWAEAFLNMEL